MTGIKRLTSPPMHDQALLLLRSARNRWVNLLHNAFWVLALALSPSTWAATYNWRTAGTSTNIWSKDVADTNWYVGSDTTYATWVDGNAAYFDDTSDSLITVSGTLAPTSLTFGPTWSNSVTITGGTLAFGMLRGVINSSAVGTSGGRVMTIGSNLTGNAGLTINAHGDLSASGGGNGGRLALTGNNSGLTGGIAITGGIVGAASNAAFGSNTITLSNYGGIVDANVGLTLSNNFVIESFGGTLRTYGNATTTLTGAISGDGGINHTDGGVLVLTGDLSGFTGELYNQAGTTALGGSASLKNSSGITVGSASIFSVRRSGVLNASSILPTALIFETFNSNFEMNSADAGAVLNLDFDMGSDWNVGLLRLAGGAVTLKNGTDVVMNSVVMYLKSATNQGTLNIEEGSTLMTTYLNVGAAASQSGVINQTGGTVTLLGGNFGFRLGHFSNAANPGSSYTLSGGVLDATFLSSNAANTDRMVNVGYDGVGTMVVGGGPGTAVLRVYGLQLDVQSPDASMVSTLTLKS